MSFPAIATEPDQTSGRRTVYPQWYGCCGKFSYGFIDGAGRTVVAPQYTNALYYDGYYLVETDKGAGAMDVYGHLLFDPKYEDIHNVSEQTAVVKLNGKYVLIDRAEHILSRPEIDFISGSSFNQHLFIATVGKKKGLIDNSGHFVVEPKHDDLNFSDEDRIEVKAHGKWGLIDGSGREIVAPKYDTLRGFREGRAAVELQGKWGVIDRDGREIVTPSYESVWIFRNGLTSFKLNGKEGFIDPTGKIVIEPRFDWVDQFFDGLARVTIDKKVGFIDTSGQLVIEPKFDSVWAFSDGLAKIEVAHRFGFIDKSGHFAIEPIFTAVGMFSEGLAGVELNYNGKYGFIDHTGRMVIEPQFPTMPDTFMGGFTKVWPNRCIDHTGRVILDLFYPLLQSCEFRDGEVKTGKIDGLAVGVDRHGAVIAHVEKRCGQTVLIDAAGAVSWPPDFEQVCHDHAGAPERLRAVSSGNYVCVRKWTSAGGYCGNVTAVINDDVLLQIVRVDINGGPYYNALEANDCSDNKTIGDKRSIGIDIKVNKNCLTGTR